MKIPSKLGLIGLKGFDLIIWPPTQLDLIGFVGSSWISRDILEARFGWPERRWFCPGQLRNSPSLTGEESSNSFAIHHHCIPLMILWLKENLPEGNLGNLVFLPPVRDGDSQGTSRYSDVRRRASVGEPEPADLRDMTTVAPPVAGQSLEQLRDASVEMRGTAVEVRDASVLRMPNFEQLRDAAIELCGAGAEVRDAAVLQGAQPCSRVTQPCSRVTRLCSCVTQLRYTVQGCVSYEVVYRFWAERIRTRLAAWRELPVEARPSAPSYTLEERDQAARSFLFYIISSQLLCSSQNKGDRAVLVCLRDLSQVGAFDWATLALAHLYHGLDVWTRDSGESNWQFIQPLEVWAYEYRIYPGGPSGDTPAESRQIPHYLAHCHHTYASGKDPEYWRSFLNDRELSDRTYPGREVAEMHTRSRFLMQGYWADRYYLGERVYDTPVAPAQRRVPHAPPRHMCLLEGMTREDLEVEYRGFSANDFLSAGDFPAYFSSRMQARLPEILEYTQERKTHKTAAHYRAEAAVEAGAAVAPAGPTGVVLGDVPFPPGMEVVLDPGLGLGSGIIIPAYLRRAPPLPQLDPDQATHVPAQRYLEICQRFGFARFYIAQLYSERHERDLEIGRLRRHQSRQSSVVSRLQAEVDRLRTRLEVEGIPLDSFGR
ncbi:hypothetical protein JCGZ_15279 [Jatropha curcas]|uniref:Aminotransferase-like plant mobile domain-containing protein n=1 Tax=Jatropha curcas TaxID=180498 RepID=A0A067K620_JATCU|nr:hypothetical protein JCGZ_15279 [Jatropha curcas]